MINQADATSKWTAVGWSVESRAYILLRGKAEDLAHKQAAVARLYETHYERVARYLAMRISNISDAEDLASEVFIRALRTVDTYRETGAPMEAWLFKIAHNLAIDYLRKKGRRPASVPLEEGFPVADKGDPCNDIERQQEIGQLFKAISQLTESQRQVLALRFAGEMTSEQVAQILGKKSGTIREMQSAAIKKLRQILKG